MSRHIPLQRIVAGPNDSAELEAMTAEHRRYKKTALGQMGPVLVVEAPLDLLAQYIVELRADARQTFLDELLARLPVEVLRQTVATLHSRLETPADLIPMPQ